VQPAPHSPHGASAAMIRAGWEVAEAERTPFHIHVAEGQYEGARTLKEHGATPIRYLDRLGVLGPRMIGVHGVWLDDEEIALMGGRGAALAYCPGSNMFLGDGITRLPEMLRAGVRVGLGTDGGCTNNRLSVFDEMRTCSLLQRVRLLDGTALPAATAFDLGTRSAAEMLGLEAGLVASGRPADLVAIDLGHLSLQPRNDLLKSVVYAMAHDAVTDVWVHGRHVVAGGPADRAGRVEIATDDAGRVRAEAPPWNVRRRREGVQLGRRVEPAVVDRVEIAGGHAEQRGHCGRRAEPQIDGARRARLADHAGLQAIGEGATETGLGIERNLFRRDRRARRFQGGEEDARLAAEDERRRVQRLDPRHARRRAPETDERGARDRRRKGVAERAQSADDVVLVGALAFGMLPRVRERALDGAAHRLAFLVRQRDDVAPFRAQIRGLPLDDARAQRAVRAPGDFDVAGHGFEKAVEANEIEHAVRVRGNERVSDDGLVQGGRNLAPDQRVRRAAMRAAAPSQPASMARPRSSRSRITGA